MRGKARARMIHGSISISERVNKLGVKGALLYTWLIPHADDYGRMSANPRVVKAMVLPLLDEITLEDIKVLLDRMYQLALITIYAVNPEDACNIENAIIQINDWHDFQRLREPRPSRYPPPANYVDESDVTRDE